MPIEQRPKHPMPKGPRPGSRTQPHKVADNDTLESLAKKYDVSIHQLVVHNFGTTHPAEINWYLREQVGCNLPTRDHKNWRFSNSAKPGLIYIPQRVLQLDPIYITGEPAVDLSLPWPLDMLASSKFSISRKIPKDGPTEVGSFLVQAAIQVEGELSQQGGEVRVTVKKSGVKAAVEREIDEQTKAVFAANLDEDKLGPVADAIRKGSVKEFMSAVAGIFETSIKQSYRFGKFSLVPEAGLEFSVTPLLLRLSAEWEDLLPIEGAMYKGKFDVKGSLNVGLSRKAGLWLLRKLGAEALKDFLFKSGERALTAIGEYLVAEGVLVAGVAIGTILGTLALTSLTAWIVQDANRKGELRGLATWYVSAYSARTFGLPRPSGFIMGNAAIRDQLVMLGEQDALNDARTLLQKIGDPAARGSDQEALDAFQRALIAAENHSYSAAKARLERSLEEKSKRLVGL